MNAPTGKELMGNNTRAVVDIRLLKPLGELIHRVQIQDDHHWSKGEQEYPAACTLIESPYDGGQQAKNGKEIEA